MQIHRSPRLYFPIDKKEKEINYQVSSPHAVNGVEKKYYYRLFKGKKTDYHSVYNKSTAFKMRSTLLTVTFSIIGEYRIQSTSYYAGDIIEYLEELSKETIS